METKRFSFLFVMMILQMGFHSFDVVGNLVLHVEHKFRGRHRTLKEMRAHDIRRHGRFLATVDMQLGGDGHPAGTG